MTAQIEAFFDLFVSHSAADGDWVEATLLPAFQRAGLTHYPEALAGIPRIKYLEDAVKRSRHTVVILTKEYLIDEWNDFVVILTRSVDPAAHRRTLIPVILKPCELPSDVDWLEAINLTNNGRIKKELGRLIDAILRETPAVWPPTIPKHHWDWLLWRRWLRRYRHQVRMGVVALLLGWVIGSTALNLPPFQQRLVWRFQQFHGEGAWRLLTAGDTLYIASRNPQPTCNVAAPRGLWRHKRGAPGWQSLPIPVEFPDVVNCKHFASIFDLAVAPSHPAAIYAATDDNGLLRSEDTGDSWKPLTDSVSLGQIIQVEVDPQQPEIVVIAIAGGGLYRSQDSGDHWQQLDQRDAATVVCEAGTAPLQQTLVVEPLLMTSNYIIAGTEQPANLLNASHVPPGLYLSQDGGDCWRRLDSGMGRMEFIQLAYIPIIKKESLLFLAKDWDQHGQPNSFGLWMVNPAETQPVQQNVWKSSDSADALYAVAEGEHIRWYLANDLGVIITGSTDPTQPEVRRLPHLVRCIACSIDLAADPEATGSHTPLLLAADRLWRLSPGSWWRLFWPG